MLTIFVKITKVRINNIKGTTIKWIKGGLFLKKRFNLLRKYSDKSRFSKFKFTPIT